MKDLKAILAGKIFTPNERIENGVILVDGHRVVRVGSKDQVKIPAGAALIDNRERAVVPGFLDIHTHGAAGHDLMEASPEAVSAVAAFLARHGITSFLATTVSADFEGTLRAARALGKIVRDSQSSQGAWGKIAGAQPLGIHFEGPFLSVKRRGAHPAAQIRKPSKQALAKLLDAAEGTARVVTMAPEVDGALPALEYARSRGVLVSLGHSNATYQEAERAIAAGATQATHCYNAMRPFSHRDPGILGAVLDDDRVSAELICDGVHVEAPAVRLLLKTKGLGRVVLVSDSISAAGMPDGNYRLGGFVVRVAEGVCRTASGGLAGSTLTLDAGLRNFSTFTGTSLETCLRCATLNPARLLGLEKQKGVIAPGADADLVVLDSNHYVTQTYVRGRPVL